MLPQELYDEAGWELPHTIASGYATIQEGDLKKNPVQVLDDHETLVKNWLQTANHYQVEAAVKTASNNEYFPKFCRDLWDQLEERKFGSCPKEDVLKFDMWLKKLEISEKGPKKFNNPSPPPAASLSQEELEIQKDENNKGAYQNYWKKYERKNGSSNLSTASTTTPSGSPPSVTPSPPSQASVASRESPTGITPECRKRLDLGGWGSYGVRGSVKSYSQRVDFYIYVLLPFSR